MNFKELFLSTVESYIFNAPDLRILAVYRTNLDDYMAALCIRGVYRLCFTNHAGLISECFTMPITYDDRSAMAHAANVAKMIGATLIEEVTL